MLNDGKIKLGEKINVCVPTGNFGNILASYYAMRMGLPVKKFICASNSNNVLTDFIRSGEYNKNRDFYTTISPSMDILVSSNLERLLYHLTDCDDKKVKEWMNELKSKGSYIVGEGLRSKITELFYGGFCDDEETKNTIKSMFDEASYLCDTHTAVAINVYENYVKSTGDNTPTVVVSTASPYKFSKAVLEAVSTSETLPENEFDMVDALHALTSQPVPAPLAALKDRKIRFNNIISVDEMPQYVLSSLGIK